MMSVLQAKFTGLIGLKPAPWRSAWLGGMLGGALLASPVSAAELPACLARAANEAPRAAMLRHSPTDQELLARLAYAEGRSTGFADNPQVYRGIAWGVMNRVRLSQVSAQARRQYGDGVAGVIFQPRQFNPAVSPRSAFAADFLCPQHAARWSMALEAAAAALRGQANPFLQTPWEQRHGRALTVNFYYPQSPQARGPYAPWENSPTLRFIGDPSPGGALPPARQIRFYRLAQPPTDLVDPPAP